MNYVEETYDIVIVGAGHAGCEAALAAARLGFETILFTVSMDSVALMPCNPNIGGSSKGHLVREIDALGGEMGKNIDKTYIQSKMLNVSKGPAVHSLRAQADKGEYTKEMRRTLQREPHLTLRQQEVTELLVEMAGEICHPEPTEEASPVILSEAKDPMTKSGDSSAEGLRMTGKRIVGVRTCSGAVYHAKAVVLCTGVYLKARCIYGDTISYTGPNGLSAANHLSDSMADAGIGIRRFKTGTPPRIDRKSIDFSKTIEQKGDEKIVPFSFENRAEDIAREQISCWLTYTNEETHQIIRENIDRSPLYSGVIQGTGPRYCPSIEDKIMKFPNKERHQLFIEPEGEFTDEMYLDGMPSSLPEDVQYRMVHSVPGLEHAKIVRNAYAIEYDCISATELRPSLEFKEVEGLFAAGQINGSSGYEEAGAQGLIAGINAARKLQGKEPVVLSRSDGYIGVLIDDLVTKETKEPYRMMTSRAEYRLLLRQDNADLRLTPIGYEIGLISEERYQKFLAKKQMIESEIARLESTPIGASKETQVFLDAHGSAPLHTGVTLADLLRRPEFTYESLAPLDPKRAGKTVAGATGDPMDGATGDPMDEMSVDVPADVAEQINISIKYEGYIKRQKQQVEHFLKMENKRIPEDMDYGQVKNLRKEARQKLEAVRPESIGQASRISGVSPADVSQIMLYLRY
ncbi:MAG: tRNA uridine-5-carboxymethylaminomethyl(34) synthesis enzyme MnmG [Eubacterium sp.]|nr:tRNA uridine-5-carboxymethylaminomethyl(34) synthesis enzyme MnmG [Eubacterium sp.]